MTSELKSKELRKKFEDIWEKIGNDNLWICESHDPPFDKSMIYACKSLKELKSKFEHGNWCLGQGFSFMNFCFINQINGGSEWLAIKDDFSFESASFDLMLKDSTYDEWMNDVFTATDKQLKTLSY